MKFELNESIIKRAGMCMVEKFDLSGPAEAFRMFAD